MLISPRQSSYEGVEFEMMEKRSGTIKKTSLRGSWLPPDQSVKRVWPAAAPIASSQRNLHR